MNRQNRILTALLVVQVIVAAIIFVPRILPSQAAAAPLLGTVQAADVSSLTIQDTNGTSVELTKKNGAWVLPQSDDYAASDDKVNAFVGKLIAVKSDPLVTRTAGSHKRLQVADDAYVRKIDLKLADGTSRTLFLGSASGTSATYIRLSGQDEVYLARGLNSFEAAIDDASWIDPTYLSVPQDKILSATLENAQGKWQFTKNAQNQWAMQGAADNSKFNPDSVVTLLARLSSVSMLKPLGKTAKPEYGLDKPSATVTVVVSDTASTKAYTLGIGTKDKAGNYPVISSESQYYVSVAAFNVDQFVSANQDTFAVKPTPTPVATLAPAPSTLITPTLEVTPVLTSTSVLTSTPPVTSTRPITPTGTPTK